MIYSVFMSLTYVEWSREFPEVFEWLMSVGLETRKIYGYHFHQWFNWIQGRPSFGGMSPGDLLDYQDNAKGRHRVDLVNQLNVHCFEAGKTIRVGTIKYRNSCVRSFFSYNGCQLPRRRLVLPDEIIPSGTTGLTREKLVNMLTAAKIRDRAMYLIAYMGAYGYREMRILTNSWARIKPQIVQGRDIIRVDLTARKKNKLSERNYFSYIAGDGLHLLKKYLEIRGEPDGPIFIRKNQNQATVDPRFKERDMGLSDDTYKQNFQTLAHRLNYMEKAGTRDDVYTKWNITPHMVRDVFRTEWQKTTADRDVAEFLMGHCEDQNKYLEFVNAPEYVEEQYRLALPRLNLFSMDPDKVDRRDHEIALARAEQENMESRRLLAEYQNELKREIEILKTKVK